MTRQRSADQLTVVNMPPPWRRSLTESGMKRRTTSLDLAIVAVFFVALIGVFAWFLLGPVPSAGA